MAKDKELGIEVIGCAIEDSKLGTEVEVNSEPELGAKVGLVLLLEEAVPLSVVVAVPLRLAVVLARTAHTCSIRCGTTCDGQCICTRHHRRR